MVSCEVSIPMTPYRRSSKTYLSSPQAKFGSTTEEIRRQLLAPVRNNDQSIMQRQPHFPNNNPPAGLPPILLANRLSQSLWILMKQSLVSFVSMCQHDASQLPSRAVSIPVNQVVYCSVRAVAFSYYRFPHFIFIIFQRYGSLSWPYRPLVLIQSGCFPVVTGLLLFFLALVQD